MAERTPLLGQSSQERKRSQTSLQDSSGSYAHADQSYGVREIRGVRESLRNVIFPRERPMDSNSNPSSYQYTMRDALDPSPSTSYERKNLTVPLYSKEDIFLMEKERRDHYDHHVDNTGNSMNSSATNIPVLYCRIPYICVNILLTIVTVFTSVGVIVTLPIYITEVKKAGSGPYFLSLFTTFWFGLIYFIVNLIIYIRSRNQLKHRTLLPTTSWRVVVSVGFLMAINGLLVVYASDPNRTSPYLQAILYTTSIPFIILFRFLILKKGE